MRALLTALLLCFPVVASAEPPLERTGVITRVCDNDRLWVEVDAASDQALEGGTIHAWAGAFDPQGVCAGYVATAVFFERTQEWLILEIVADPKVNVARRENWMRLL